MSIPIITRVALYVRDMPKIAAFYEKHFGFVITPPVLVDKLVLVAPGGGCKLVLLQASKGHRIGQSCVKLIFDVADVAAFKAEKLRAGLKFGPIHQGDGYKFANARDPARNLIQISNSAMAGNQQR